MIKNKEFIQEIYDKAIEFELTDLQKSSSSITINFSYHIGVKLTINISEKNEIEFYFWVRTNSAIYPGERTDLHDIYSVLFASLLKELNISSSVLFDYPHPVADLDNEIYARYIVPSQLNPKYSKTNSETLDVFKNLTIHLSMLQYTIAKLYGGCFCSECLSKEKFDGAEFNINKDFLTAIYNIIGISEVHNSKSRKIPYWNYHRDFKKNVSIIHSPFLAFLFKSFIDSNIIKKELIQGEKGNMIISENLNNYLPNRVKNKAQKILKKIDLNIDKVIPYITLENKTIFIGNEFTIFIDSNSGLSDFKVIREKLREKHNKEFKLLFAPSKIKWKEKVNDELFENLIKDLLENEPDITRVRKVAHTNEGDGGRDLIIEKNILNRNPKKEDTNPYLSKKIIVQCKAYKKGVGKNNVTDIRDIIEFNEYDGYFLIVSSYLNRSLTDHLDRLKSKNKYWIDWWTRQEIDERLKMNPEILNKYPEIFDL